MAEKEGRRFVTIEQIANHAAVSVATVSLSLRGSTKVRPATAARVRASAEALGYVANASVSRLMSHIRLSRPIERHAAIAAITTLPRDRLGPGTFFGKLFAGAVARAAELGYRLDYFPFSDPDPDLPRLNRVLETRGIQGALLLPMATGSENFAANLDWSRLSAVAIGPTWKTVAVNRVSPDHFQLMWHLLDHLKASGYRRYGLVLETGVDERLRWKWTAAFNRWVLDLPSRSRVKSLLLPAPTLEEIQAWIGRERPDVLVTTGSWALPGLRAAGLRIPEALGYATLNADEGGFPCSGIDQNAAETGAVAIDQVVTQIHQNRFGLPRRPWLLEVPGSFVEAGTTLTR